MNIGVVGSRNSGKETLGEMLRSSALEYKKEEKFQEFRLLYENIIFKLRLFFSSSFEVLEQSLSGRQRLDGLIVMTNIYDRSFLESSLREKIENLKSLIEFDNYKVLVAIEEQFAERFKIRDKELIQKAKDLDFIYYFKLNAPTKKKDVMEIFHKILSDFLLKFKYSNPEMYELAIKFGMSLKKKGKEGM